jgi:hypothetical protein
MRALAFAAAFALIGSAAGAQTMKTKETVTTPTTTTTTTTRTHTMPAGSMAEEKSEMKMHRPMAKHHAMRHCTTKWRHGKKIRTCTKTMMHKKMVTTHKM